VTDQFVRACRKHGFEDIAHTLMPDHAHALIRGVRADSDFLKWLGLWRQLSGYWWKRQAIMSLWQEGYWDYTLRDDESVPAIASYIVWNPVVAGLVAKPEDYPYTGSDCFTIAELAAVKPLTPRCGDL
jgi:REP element-mobilizing transposase RayT